MQKNAKREGKQGSDEATRPALPPLAYTINESIERSKLSRSYLNTLIKTGALDTVKLGRRRLVKADSLHRLFEAA